MKCRQWYYAQLRWAVMVEGRQGLREWKQAVHLFLSDDREAAFQQALLIGSCMVALAACSMWFIVGELKPIPIRQEHPTKGQQTPTP